MEHDVRIEFLSRLNRLAGLMSQYESILEAMYRRILQPGDCIFDVGCHSGRHARAFIDAVGPSGRVVGFEPIPGMAAILRNLEADVPNFTVFEVALSNESGRASFVHAEGTPEESGLIEREFNFPDRARPRRIEVELRRLDDLATDAALPDPAFIKLDVEGAELRVLEGAADLIARARPICSIEYGAPGYGPYGHTAESLWNWSNDTGYVLFDLFGYRLPTLDTWLAECDRGLWDWFAVPVEKADSAEAAWR